MPVVPDLYLGALKEIKVGISAITRTFGLQLCHEFKKNNPVLVEVRIRA